MASESRIRDVDMAKEMTNFTKLNILQQAGTSMLAQANQAPQNILSLLPSVTRLDRAATTARRSRSALRRPIVAVEATGSRLGTPNPPINKER